MARNVDTIRDAMPGTLFIVSTPIGNLGDMTKRAVETLSTVSVVACEDTRTTGKLLRHYNIGTTTLSYHDHNETQRAPKLIERPVDATAISQRKLSQIPLCAALEDQLPGHA